MWVLSIENETKYRYPNKWHVTQQKSREARVELGTAQPKPKSFGTDTDTGLKTHIDTDTAYQYR